jgi:hypothetical protein
MPEQWFELEELLDAMGLQSWATMLAADLTGVYSVGAAPTG